MKKDGLYERSWDEEKKEFRDLPIPQWVGRWTELIERVDEDVTLGDVFSMVRKLPEDIRQLVGEMVGSREIDLFLEEALEPLGPDEEKWLHYVEVYRLMEIWDHKEGGLNQADSYAATAGRCEGDDTRYSYSLLPTNQLVHIKIKLTNELRLVDMRKGQETEEQRLRCSMTLGEFMYAVFDDIVFYGPPKERDEFLSDLRKAGGDRELTK